MQIAIINVIIRSLSCFLVLATLVPFIPVGFWPVRLCDFFRLQICVVAATLVVSTAIWAQQYQWSREHLLWIGLNLAVALWQGSHVVPYTPLWAKEIEDATQTESQPVGVAVVNLKIENEEKQAVLQQLSALDVDLLLLIEIDDAWEDALKPLEADYPYREGVVRDEGVGIMLWSKLELRDPQIRHLVSPNRASIFADVLIGDGQVLSFVGVHPLPPGLPQDDESGRHDSRIRDAELMLVAKETSREPDRQWIVTGDFNDVAWSHTTRMFQRISGLQDPRVGRGLYNTYHAQVPIMRFPIDQVFLSPGAQIHHLGRIHPQGSDHFAIVTDFSFAKQEKARSEASAEDLEEAEEMVDEGREDAEKDSD